MAFHPQIDAPMRLPQYGHLVTMAQISVVMPVHNGGVYLEKSIASILGQSFQDFEFIIINDGSTDASLAVMQRFAAADQRIRLVSRENRGLVSTLNEGIALATSPLIARMDADDIALPERFQLQKDFLDQHPDVVAVGGRVKVIDGKGRFLINTNPKTGHENLELSALQGVSPIIHPSAMIRKASIDHVGGYHESDYPAEDLALWLNLSLVGKIENIPDLVLEYRIHDNSISTSKHRIQMDKTREICAAACDQRNVKADFLATEGRPEESRASQYSTHLKHGWWAYGSKEWRTSAIYALKAIGALPYKLDGWNLLYCALFKKT
jgi:glycosyltransferase involved in cell wall biosynthesis